MSIVANEVGFFIRADTRARAHTLVIIDAIAGARTTSATSPATNAGMTREVNWITKRTTTPLSKLVVIEGIGSCGARLARALGDGGYHAVGPFATPATARRGRGEGDDIDAELIARFVLASETDRLREPREDCGVREALRDT